MREGEGGTRHDITMTGRPVGASELGSIYVYVLHLYQSSSGSSLASFSFVLTLVRFLREVLLGNVWPVGAVLCDTSLSSEWQVLWFLLPVTACLLGLSTAGTWNGFDAEPAAALMFVARCVPCLPSVTRLATTSSLYFRPFYLQNFAGSLTFHSNLRQAESLLPRFSS